MFNSLSMTPIILVSDHVFGVKEMKFPFRSAPVDH